VLRRSGITIATALAVLLATAPAAVAGSSDATTPGQPAHLASSAIRRVLDGQSRLTHHLVQSATLPGTTVQTWRHTVSDAGTNYQYTMVGRNPTVAQTTQAVSIPTQVVPLIIKFVNGHTWNPTVGDSCDTTSALTRTMASPIFKNHTYAFGGTSVGSTQYIDAFQRANYFKYTGPSGINSGYHVTLAPVTLSPITVSVPSADSAEGTAGCGNRVLGAVDIDWLDNYLQHTVIPSLASKGVGVKTFPLFVLGNVVEYLGTPDNCCVLGFHNAYQTATGRQTYAVAMYDNTGVFGRSKDVSVLSHEVGEWLADPLANNPTRSWGHVGQVSGCQSSLEVGDPLSGTIQSVVVSSHTYHVQELAFTSWFYHQATSTGVNGWYSNYGTFRTYAATCP
jgi:hypothetical protein